jgi:pyridoxine 5-phosphate synthase
MTSLSVNVNKIATLRNARGGNQPDLVKVVMDCEKWGAQGITVHPRPDERHIRYKDVEIIRPLITTEFNIEGNPTPEFIQLVLKFKPDQVTLVPDDPAQLTSDHGWDTIAHHDFLIEVIDNFKKAGIRTSVFVDPATKFIEGAKLVGADRVELYTESYAAEYEFNREAAIAPFIEAAIVARDLQIGLNAGHDLNLDNLKFFHQQIPWLDEVSIGHALICDALTYGLENTIHLYLRQLSDK